MNALANDQEERFRSYLESSGHTGVKVARHDRTTTQSERESLRKTPPHILLTNYMMLEYLLVRPADREALFANHRCRFVVFDEVHTYRGSLGANIALLFRRLRSHLREARQDWQIDDPDFIPRPVQDRAMAWEEAPLLDDVSVSAGYRATIVNLGLVGVRYDKLAEYIDMDAVNPSVDHLTGHLDPRYASGDR